MGESKYNISGNTTFIQSQVGDGNVLNTRAAKPETERSAEKVRILFLSANPQGTPPLELHKEVEQIQEALETTLFGSRFELEPCGAVRPQDLQRLLASRRPDIVQFSGHGSSKSGIILEDETGAARLVSITGLGNIFSFRSPNLRCVVLNACYTEEQAKVIAHHVDCVIGMSSAINDSAAIDFSRALYSALGSGADLMTAFERGQAEIGLTPGEKPELPVMLSTHHPQQTVFASETPSRR